MANQFEIYKCELCGNVIEVLFAGSGGPLSCCGQPMKLMADKAIDGAKEKHVPVIEANGAGCKVKVGSAPHVMEETHWIEWIEIATAAGDPDSGIAPGTAFEDLPEDWVCPVCGASKSDFSAA